MKTYRIYRFKTGRAKRNCFNCAYGFDKDSVLTEENVEKTYVSCEELNIDVFGARRFKCSNYIPMKGYIRFTDPPQTHNQDT
jgi:hypothetical protein